MPTAHVSVSHLAFYGVCTAHCVAFASKTKTFLFCQPLHVEDDLVWVQHLVRPLDVGWPLIPFVWGRILDD